MRNTQILACHQTGQRKVCPSGCCFTTLPNMSLSELSGPTQSMSQLGTGCRATRSGERLELRTQRQPRGPECGPGGAAVATVHAFSNAKQLRLLTAAQPLQFLHPQCHNPQHQLSECSGPTYSVPNPCTRSGTIGEETTTLGCV